MRAIFSIIGVALLLGGAYALSGSLSDVFVVFASNIAANLLSIVLVMGVALAVALRFVAKRDGVLADRKRMNAELPWIVRTLSISIGSILVLKFASNDVAVSLAVANAIFLALICLLQDLLFPPSKPDGEPPLGIGA